MKPAAYTSLGEHIQFSMANLGGTLRDSLIFPQQTEHWIHPFSVSGKQPILIVALSLAPAQFEGEPKAWSFWLNQCSTLFWLLGIGSLDFSFLVETVDFPLDPRKVKLFADGSTATKKCQVSPSRGFHRTIASASERNQLLEPMERVTQEGLEQVAKAEHFGL